MISILSTVIGIVFVMLLFSLLASSIMELIAGILSLRGKQLISAIRGMIGRENSDAFIRHPFFQQLAIGSKDATNATANNTNLPSYISANAFSDILFDTLEIDSKTDLETKLGAMPEGPHKKLAIFLYKQTDGQFFSLKKRVEDWFNEVMERTTGAYKRSAQKWLVGIGLMLAILFNVDVITIYHNLSINATLSNLTADQATVFVNTQQEPTSPKMDNPELAIAKLKIGVLINENISALESPLGLGWDPVDWAEVDFWWWLYKGVGWLTTALGISLGATFWFELLKKLINLRSAGPPPQATTPPPATTTPVVLRTETPSLVEGNITLPVKPFG